LITAIALLTTATATYRELPVSFRW